MSGISNQEVKVLLKLMIEKITINELREIDSITLQLNKELVEYINGGDASKMEASLSFMKKIKLNVL